MKSDRQRRFMYLFMRNSRPVYLLTLNFIHRSKAPIIQCICMLTFVSISFNFKFTKSDGYKERIYIMVVRLYLFPNTKMDIFLKETLSENVIG